MDDLISRQAMIDELKDRHRAADKWWKDSNDIVIKARAESCKATLIEVQLCIEKLPSAEPEIIRCKNCKYYDGRPCGNVDWYNTDSDYCSRAEGRTDE